MKLVKYLINLREILGLDNIVIKITFGFALVMLTNTLVLEKKSLVWNNIYTCKYTL